MSLKEQLVLGYFHTPRHPHAKELSPSWLQTADSPGLNSHDFCALKHFHNKHGLKKHGRKMHALQDDPSWAFSKLPSTARFIVALTFRSGALWFYDSFTLNCKILWFRQRCRELYASRLSLILHPLTCWTSLMLPPLSDAFFPHLPDIMHQQNKII